MISTTSLRGVTIPREGRTRSGKAKAPVKMYPATIAAAAAAAASKGRLMDIPANTPPPSHTITPLPSHHTPLSSHTTPPITHTPQVVSWTYPPTHPLIPSHPLSYHTPTPPITPTHPSGRLLDIPANTPSHTITPPLIPHTYPSHHTHTPLRSSSGHTRQR